MVERPQVSERQPQLLVVDDDEHVRRTLVRVARHMGLVATGASDGVTAMNALRAAPADYDLVLLDIEMPGPSGLSVLDEMKRDKDLMHVPVLVLSGSANLDHVVRCIELGADDFIGKPFAQAVLQARISSSLAKKRMHDWEQRYLRLLEEEEARSGALIASVLPDVIASRLKRGERQIADYVDDVSVLFADIVGFTPHSANKTPHEVVALLNGIFSQIDAMAGAHQLEKIKTVGDAYMVVGGLPEPHEGHLEAVADLALEIIREIPRAHGLEMRIGIHCGPAVAGVIGTRKLFYDVWGDTINVASRMESHGVAGKIHTSSEVRARLEPRFELTERGPIELKGRGTMVTHFLVGRR